jgi:hypothetical protein
MMVVESEVGMNWKKEVGRFADLGEGGTENILGGRGCKGGSDENTAKKSTWSTDSHTAHR